MARPSSFRLSSFALGAALLVALAGLWAADRLLIHSEETPAEMAAVESAAIVQGFLAVHAQALQAVHGLYLDTNRVVPADELQAILRLMTQHATAFRRVWVTDTAGVIRYQYLVGHPEDSLPPMDVDTVTRFGTRLLAGAARRTRHLQLSHADTLIRGEARGLLLIEPIYVGDHFMGFAGGTITTRALLAALRAPTGGGAPLARMVFAGADTIAVDLRAPGGGQLTRIGPDTIGQPLTTPSDEQWHVVVAYEAGGRRRLAVWGIGLAMLGTLFVSLVHERRQGLRLAERSAELERLSSELLRANRAKSEFLANVSHELRTPLNAIVGFVELLRDGVYGELMPRQVNPVDRVASSANHLRHLVDQILDIAKMAAGRMEIHPESTDLRVFVLNVVGEVEALVNERGLSLSIAVPATLPRVRTDPTHLRQVVVNLIGNAIKFTPTGGIAVRARVVRDADLPAGGPPSDPSGTPSAGPRRQTGGVAVITGGMAAITGLGRAPEPRAGGRSWIALQVADTGIGIARTDQERIFEEFEQVNAGPRGDSMQRGTGLGLPISRRLARLLGGDVTVESEPGKGATFTVWLPVDPNEAGTRAGAREPGERAGGLGTREASDVERAPHATAEPSTIERPSS